ncbi:MAG: TIGR03086 family metal-binding protein [Acidimicrobiia bacterium]|nr:TIGR03086 family metal-binding protein [Acidimicrobiia bacterium]
MSADGDDPLAILSAALAFFGELVREVTDEQWEASTPCDDWNVRDIVAHVVVNEALMTALVRDEDVAWDSDINASVLGANALATWRGTALAARDAFSAPGVLDRTFTHPDGDADGMRLLGARVSENVVHGWDIAEAIGSDKVIPDDLVEWLRLYWLPLAADVIDSDAYAAPVEIGVDTDGAGRLLALLGRSTS